MPCSHQMSGKWLPFFVLIFLHYFVMGTNMRRVIKLGTIVNRWSVKNMLFIFLLKAFLCISALFRCYARDTITIHELITSGETLISDGERFEFGFFTPGISDRRYIGIWFKSDPRTIVWVARPDNPLTGAGGVVAIRDGNLKVLDETGKSYWSTGVDASVSHTRAAKLLDSGNLVLIDDPEGTVLWQSFKNPTDTFLSGMNMDESMTLVSWKSPEDPSNGNFTFKMGEDNPYIISKRSIIYWASGDGSEKMLPGIAYMLSNFSRSKGNSSSEGFRNKRVVMNHTGEIQYWSWDNKSGWSLIWKEPRDSCSVFNACGKFGNCNLKSDPICNCLTGFKPASLKSWEAGDFSGGCTAKSISCEKYKFLNYSKMKVGKTDSQFKADNETECRKECDCQCQAYSYDEAIDSTQRGNLGTNGMCWIWREGLTNLQEEYSEGRNLSVRVPISDEESTPKNCEICGTMIVPYPLSSGPNCGDPMYFSFQCNTSTNQLSFKTSSGLYQVSSIDPDTQKFVILAKIKDNCDARSSKDTIQQLNQSMVLPFTITSACNDGSSNTTSDAVSIKNRGEIEIGWEPPLEPTCTSSIDCQDWPLSTCNATRNGSGRCLCNTNFKWDPSTLNCTNSTQGSGPLEPKSNDGSRSNKKFILIVGVTVSSVGVFSCAIAYIYIWRRNERRRENMAIQRKPVVHRFDSERHAKELIETGEFKEEDKKGIDVPFFEFQSIVAATDHFSDANKLGQGGYGPVYKGTFPGGKEIAVKRLSSFSGQGLQEFKNEVVLIAKLQHRNLVKLWGYCVEGDEKILLYEYMPNRSLDAFIFDSKLSASLDWEMRFSIIMGIARGLLYLHQDSRLRIIHRDMKTSNILLDEEMNPKISDFGLARIVGGKQNEANTNRVVGTYGYMSPEYALDGIFSVKSDVFSFGVVILEIISGKRNTGFYRSKDALSLLGYAWRFWEDDNTLNLMDQTLGESCNRGEFMKCVNVGLLCVQEDPNDRPDISTVIVMLGSESAALPAPKQPAFVAARTGLSTSDMASSSSASKPETGTQLTNSFVEGR